MTKKMFIDFNNPIPIYQEIDFESEEIPFGLQQARRENLYEGLRCENLNIITHAHVSHLETRSHLGGSVEHLPLSLNEPLLTQIVKEEDDELSESEDLVEKVQFVIIKKSFPAKRNFKGVNLNFIEKVLEKYPNIVAFGINEPSVDPEDDGGLMLAHRTIFDNITNKKIYLVELLSLDKVDSGIYYCFLNLFRYGLTDAYPCSPVLFRIPAKMALTDSCLFCKIIRGVIPSFKVYESDLTLAFLDINPLSEGHIVISIEKDIFDTYNCF